MVGLVAISQLRLTRPGPLDRGVARATSRNPAQQFEGWRLSAPRAVDRPRLIGWSSLRQERRQSLRSFVAVAGTPARFPEPRGARKGRQAFRTCRPCREPAKPSSSLSARLATFGANEQDPFRRVAMGRGRIPGHQADECARWGRALTVPVPFSPRSSRRERRQTSRGNLLGQRSADDSPCGSSSDRTRGASDRLLPSHVCVRAPAPRGSRCASGG